MARHIVEELTPEIHAPNFGDVQLSGGGGVGVAGGAKVEGDVELDAALGDVGCVGGISQSAEGAGANGFGIAFDKAK